MGLISAVSVVIYTVKPARMQAEFDTPLILAWGMLIGGTALTIAFRPWNNKVIFDGETFTALTFIILFGTMAGFSMYMTGVKMIGSGKGKPLFLRGTGSLYGINRSMDESQLHYTGSDRNSICNCYHYYSGTPYTFEKRQRFCLHETLQKSGRSLIFLPDFHISMHLYILYL